MKVLIVNNHTTHLAQLVRLFAEFEVDVLDCDTLSSQKTAKYDLIVLSGGTHVSAADSTKKAYEHEIDFIKKTKKPVIGICLGSQLIAKAFGGKLEKLERKCHGIIELAVENKKYKLYESHRYVIKKLPARLDLLAKSNFGVEIFKHKTKPIYGFQFHPEARPRTSDGKKLFEKVLNSEFKS